ncbi:hypothetical protein HZC31_03495 [Candidatus Woesearchaeota archaeon]|nr:hypothetical protein [Candidatus Woesearchaeota archaeon]
MDEKLIEKINRLNCLDCGYKVRDLERDLAKVPLPEAAAVLALASQKFSGKKELGGNDLDEYIDRYVKLQLDQTTDLPATYEVLYTNLPQATLAGVVASEQAWRNLKVLFRFHGSYFGGGSLKAPTGKKLLETVLSPPKSAAFRTPYAAIDIVTAATWAGLYDSKDYLQELAGCISSGGCYSDIGQQRIFRHLESRLSEAVQNEGSGFRVVDGKFWGQLIYYDEKCLGLYCDVTPDPSGKARWITEEVIGKDCTGMQRRITLWSYDPKSPEPNIIFEDHKYSREGTLPTARELFARFENV